MYFLIDYTYAYFKFVFDVITEINAIIEQVKGEFSSIIVSVQCNECMYVRKGKASSILMLIPTTVLTLLTLNASVLPWKSSSLPVATLV